MLLRRADCHPPKVKIPGTKAPGPDRPDQDRSILPRGVDCHPSEVYIGGAEAPGSCQAGTDDPSKMCGVINRVVKAPLNAGEVQRANR